MDDNKCCICGANYGRYGNNAEPVASGRCCNDCNAEVIIPARISMMFGAENSTYESVMVMIENLSDDDYKDFCYEMDIDSEDMEELSSFVMRNYDSNRVMGFLNDRGFGAEDDTILAQMYEIEDMENPSELDLKNYRNLEIKYDELTRMDAEDMQPLFDDLKKQATKFTGMTILFTGIAAIGGYLIGRNRA